MAAMWIGTTQARAWGKRGFSRGVELRILWGNYAVWRLSSPHSLGSWETRCSTGAKLSLSSLGEFRRDLVGRKGVKGLLLVGHEKVPCGFGIRTGDPSNTADGAGNQGRLPAQHGLLERSEGYLSHRPLFLS